jgi:hypothetical protein
LFDVLFCVYKERDKEMATTNTLVPAVMDFIDAFAAKTWAVATRKDPANPYWEAATHHFAGFYVAFEIIFGRAATEFEVDTLQLNLREREHQHLIARGQTATGMSYSAWWPGDYALCKLRHKLGKPNGAKTSKEWYAMVDAARSARPRAA